MKWENRDINAVERANTPKLSKLDNIGTPLRLFESFLDDPLVYMIVDYSKLYSHRRKADTSFEISNETFRLGMRLIIGCHKLPDRKMYWEAPPALLYKQCLIQCLLIAYSSKSPSLWQWTIQ